ncbi:hypothetical protein [Vulcaniibacterium gelatinicum]|uniref:hypothetical protein n=1 Tax=Vulcaniibacterium gelatinicum TaxID=2598725 RepID=UPI0011CB09D6|nr:hypothetical protein [Vulcaniibacterium gelatinicum]
MLVSELVENMREAFAQFPAATGWRVGAAACPDSPGHKVEVRPVGSFHARQEGQFFLVPEGMGELFELEEWPFVAGELLQAMEALAEWGAFEAYFTHQIIPRPDGPDLAESIPLCGFRVSPAAELVYFLY